MKKERIGQSLRLGMIVSIVIISCKTVLAQKANNENFQQFSITNTTKTEIKELNIGDKIPDVILNKVLNYRSKTARLSDFKGKLIILDFWSTWCGTCIQLFPHMNSLQKEFGDRIQIILVNGKTKVSKDDEIKINKTLTRLKDKAGVELQLPIIYDCEILDSYFPWKSIPHEVWIEPNGEIIAITGHAEVTKENIQALLEGKKVSLRRKRDDLDFNSRKPLFVNGNGGDGNEFIYRSIITKYKEGVESVRGMQPEKDGKISRIYILNYPLLSLFKSAYQDMMIMYPDNRILIEVADRSKFHYTEIDKYDKSYCYELIVPPLAVAEVRKYMQNDLERQFHTVVRSEKRKMNCLILTIAAKAKISYAKKGRQDLDLEKTTTKKYMRNYPMTEIISSLNQYLKLPLIDETSLNGNIDIDLPYDLTDLESLKESFRKQGFQLTEAERELDIIVITDKQ